MSKVLVQLPTSAFAAHIARKKWGEGFELSNRQHHFLYKHLAYTPLKSIQSIPTKQHDTLQFYCEVKTAKKSERFLCAIGSELHDHFMVEMNTYLLGYYDSEDRIVTGIKSYMDKMDFTEDILDMDTIKKSFYRFRSKMSNIYSNSHNKVINKENNVTLSISSHLKYLISVLYFSELRLLPENDFLSIFKVQLKDFHSRPCLQLVELKKVYCYLLHDAWGYSYNQIARKIKITRYSAIRHVKRVRKVINEDEFLKKAICMN